MMVTVDGLSGLTKAYRSVASICGSAATSGASRWLDALPGAGPSPLRKPTPSAIVATAETAMVRNRLPLGKGVPSSLKTLVEARLATRRPGPDPPARCRLIPPSMRCGGSPLCSRRPRDGITGAIGLGPNDSKRLAEWHRRPRDQPADQPNVS